MKVSLVRPADLSAADVRAWREMQAGDPALASPYLCPEFSRLVGAAREDVWVALVRDGAERVAFFPFQRRAGRVARPVGGALSDCHAVIAPPGVVLDGAALVAACGLAVFDFDNLRATQRVFADWHARVEGSHVIDLAGGFEAYEAERRSAGSGLIPDLLRSMRRIEREAGPLTFTAHDPDPNTLDRLLAWKRDQYRRTRATDPFVQGWAVSLLRAIHAARTPDFAGELSTLAAGGRLVAAHMGMRSASVLHYWFPAYDEAFARYSPGLLLLLMIARDAAARGLAAIELGKGDSGYKRRFANAAVPVAVGSVELPSLARTLRNLRRAVETASRRLPIGPAAEWPSRAFRRLDRARSVR